APALGALLPLLPLPVAELNGVYWLRLHISPRIGPLPTICDAARQTDSDTRDSAMIGRMAAFLAALSAVFFALAAALQQRGQFALARGGKAVEGVGQLVRLPAVPVWLRGARL